METSEDRLAGVELQVSELQDDAAKTGVEVSDALGHIHFLLTELIARSELKGQEDIEGALGGIAAAADIIR